MPCENYREALIDAAAANSAPTRELRSHLDACASCRAAFAEEQQLFAAIDTSLLTVAHAEVPASFLPRVGAHIEEALASPRRRRPSLILAVAGAAAVVAVFIGVGPHHPVIDNQTRQIAAMNAPKKLATPTRRETPESPLVVALARAHSVQRIGHFKTPSSASSGTFEVIVPPEEREALARFVNAQQKQSDVVIAVVAPAGGQEYAPLSVEPLVIARLRITALEQLESGAPDSTQEEQ
ncbi:MAG: hypothetical protein WBE13_21570 [Candidatus Acidiferrum sp.]